MSRVHPAVIAIWAALIVSASFLPTLPIWFTGSTFSLASALIPLAGIFFGPEKGALCAAIAQVAGTFIAPHTAWLGIWTPLVGTANAYVSGCVSRKRWAPALGVIVAGWALWYTSPVGREAAIFPAVFYSLGIAAAVTGSTWGSKFISSPGAITAGAGIWLASFAGFVGAAAVGNVFGLLLLRIPAKVWKALVFVSPWERSLFSLMAAVVGVPLMQGLRKVGIGVGPRDR
ncbi:MAG: hypothetical protein HPY55_15405 [Firmicutes bacterium]|nr:hypothetical protein [Bacillota bacterium]